jgi:hypothetical protein
LDDLNPGIKVCGKPDGVSDDQVDLPAIVGK